MFSGEHVLYRTHSVENTFYTEHNFWRTCSLLFFYSREKILCVGVNVTIIGGKKKDLKIAKKKTRKRGKNPPSRTNISIGPLARTLRSTIRDVDLFETKRRTQACGTKAGLTICTARSRPRCSVSQKLQKPEQTICTDPGLNQTKAAAGAAGP